MQNKSIRSKRVCNSKRRANPPRRQKPSIELLLPSHLVARAAKIIAVAAYPAVDELQEDGPAHKFSQAMLAWMYRVAKARGKIRRLPDWVSAIKAQQMTNRLSAGIGRLHYRIAGYRTMLDALSVAVESDHLADGVIPGFTVRFSEEFDRARIVFQPHTEAILPGIWKSAEGRARAQTAKLSGFPSEMPGIISPSLKAAVLRHRKAFKSGSRDPQTFYVNVYNRYLKVLFPAFPIVSVLDETMREKVKENPKRAKMPVQLLLLQPEWAGDAPARIRGRMPSAIQLMRGLGIEISRDGLIHFKE